MMKAHATKILTAVSLVAVLALASYAFAGWGHRGYGPRHGDMMGYYGPGGAEGGRSGYGRGYGADVTQEQIEKMEAQRRAFFEETEPLRQQLYEKNSALRSELAKENPDDKAARNLQQEISALRADLDQKRLDHRMQMREIAPEVGRGYRAGGPGYGYGSRGPRGGGYGPGYCWR